MKKKKLVLSIIFFIALLGATYYFIFSKYDFNEVISNLKLMNPFWIGVAASFLVLYFLCQAFYFKVIYRSMNEKVSVFKCYFYSIIEFFFSGITPSASGGQPVQLIYMSKDGIPMRKSMIALLLNLILFKLFNVTAGILILIFTPTYVFDHGQVITVLFWAGLIYDLIIVFLTLGVMFNKRMVRFVVKLATAFIKMFRKKKQDQLHEKINEALEKYLEEAEYVKQHVWTLLFGMIITFVQRVLMFSIVFTIYRGFGNHDVPYYELLLMQIFFQITVEAVFLPGGTGVIELVNNKLLIAAFGGLSASAMLLNRALTFYIPLIVILIAYLIINFFCYKLKGKNGGVIIKGEKRGKARQS